MRYPFRWAIRHGSFSLLLAILFFLPGISLAQQPPHWRFWKDPNEPPPAPAAGWVSVNRDRSVLLLQWTQGAGRSGFFVTWFDGYKAVSFPKHHGMKMPIPCQGLSGQIWAISLDFPSDPYRTVSIDRYAFGWDLSEREWFYHDLDDISFLDSTILPPARVTNLIPISRDRLVILLQDQLIGSDASFENPTILKSSTETSLGNFIHLAQSRDAGLWITGERGLAKATGFDGDSMQWEEFIIPEELGLRDLAIPIEGDFGEVFVTVSSIPDGRRMLARFDGSAWEIISFAGAQDAVM
ncbi:MAG: hypothetical protein ABIH23_16105, partial [bacterium]